MQGVSEEGRLTGRRQLNPFVSTDNTKLTQKEKNVTLPHPGKSEREPVQLDRFGDVRSTIGEIRRSRMTREDLEFFYSALVCIRKDTTDLMDFLVRFDDGLTTWEAEQLTACIQIIKKARGF